MAIKPELLKLGSREMAKRKGVLSLMFYDNQPIVMRSIHEDARKEEAVFAPFKKKFLKHESELALEEEKPELLKMYAQGLLADSWTSPGGAIESGEFPEETVQREFHEEVLMSVNDHRPKDERLITVVSKTKIKAKMLPEIPIPVVVQTNKKQPDQEPFLRGVFEVLTARIDLSDEQFFPLCGAGIFRYLSDIHVSEKLRPTLKYLLLVHALLDQKRRNNMK